MSEQRERPEVPAEVQCYSEMGEPPEALRPLWLRVLGWTFSLGTTAIVLGGVLCLSPAIVGGALFRHWRVSRPRLHRDPRSLRIAVIGGGWTGVQVTSRLLELGVEHVVVYERAAKLGGTWRAGERYHGLQMHSPGWFSSFVGAPIAEGADALDGKIRGDRVEAYVDEYAAARGVVDRCLFNRKVLAVHCDAAGREATLDVAGADGSVRAEGPYDFVLWTSTACEARFPRLPGAEAFAGEQLHVRGVSTEVFDRIVRSKLRVAVVGGSKGACDMALALRRAGHTHMAWVARSNYMFIKFERAFHRRSLVGLATATVTTAGLLVSAAFPALAALMWHGMDYFCSYGPLHLDLGRMTFGVLDARQRKDLQGVQWIKGEPAALEKGGLRLVDGTEVPCDMVIWCTGHSSGLDGVQLTRGGEPVPLGHTDRLFEHFLVPDCPVLGSATALFTTFGPARGTSAAELAVYNLCARPSLPDAAAMRRAARRYLVSGVSPIDGLVWSKVGISTQWTRLHLDLMLTGVEPVESFLRHALGIFFLNSQPALDLKLLPEEVTRARQPCREAKAHAS